MHLEDEDGKPLARFGGTSYLETVEETTMKSLPHSLLHRELGMCMTNRNGRFFGTNAKCIDALSSCIIQRQLLKARGPRPAPSTKPKRRSRDIATATRAALNTDEPYKLNDGHTAIVVDINKLRSPGHVMIHDFLFLHNKRTKSYDCMVYDQVTRMRKAYSIPADKKWLQWALAEVAEPLDVKIVKESPTFYVLQKPGLRLQAFNLESGVLLYNQLLDPEIRFGGLEFSDSRNEMLVTCVEQSLPKTLAFDCIMIDRGFKPKIRWQMQRSVIPHGKVEQTDGMIMLDYSSRIEIFDLDKTLQGARVPSTAEVNADGCDSVPVTHIITTRPEVLYTIPTRKSHLQDMSYTGYPPHLITSNNGHGMFKVYDIQSNEMTKNHSLVSLDEVGEESVIFHPDDSPRLLVLATNIFRVVSIQRRENSVGFTKSELVEEFHVRFTEQNEPIVLYPPHLKTVLNPVNVQAESGTVSSRPRRSGVTKSYKETEGSDVLICFEYCSSLDYLLIMKIMPECLRFYIYDNRSWKLISTLNGLEHAIGKLDIVEPGIFSVALSPQQITVRKDTKRNPEVIIFPLLTVPSFLVD